MTGAEHYTLADDILKRLREERGTFPEEGLEYQTLELARAQAHATMALAAATAQASVDRTISGYGR